MSNLPLPQRPANVRRTPEERGRTARLVQRLAITLVIVLAVCAMISQCS